MKTKTITCLISFLLLTLTSVAQNSSEYLEGKFIFSTGYSGANIVFETDYTYTLTASSCLSKCKQEGKWIMSSDTIQLQTPTLMQGTDECPAYFEMYSVLVRKSDKLIIMNTDSTLKDKLFFVKAQPGKAKKK